jgi:hypothetical protein
MGQPSSVTRQITSRLVAATYTLAGKEKPFGPLVVHALGDRHVTRARQLLLLAHCTRYANRRTPSRTTVCTGQRRATARSEYWSSMHYRKPLAMFEPSRRGVESMMTPLSQLRLSGSRKLLRKFLKMPALVLPTSLRHVEARWRRCSGRSATRRCSCGQRQRGLPHMFGAMRSGRSRSWARVCACLAYALQLSSDTVVPSGRSLVSCRPSLIVKP